MNQKSLNWGIGITVVWLAVIVAFWVFGGLKSPTSLNELGDFLAGIFAPVAFLWLILGYVQQGKQLEQNTKALEQQERALQLQIDEMKESVKQQKSISEIQYKQYKMVMKSVLPAFTAQVLNFSKFYKSQTLEYQFGILCTNIGAEISDFLVICDDSEEILFGANIFKRGETIKDISFNTREHIELYENEKCCFIKLRVFYTDIYKNEHSELHHLEFVFNTHQGEKYEAFVSGFRLIDNNYEFFNSSDKSNNHKDLTVVL